MSAATKAVAAKSVAATEEEVTPFYAVDALVSDYQSADVAQAEQTSIFLAAQAALSNISYVKARTVYLLATHEEVLTSRTKKEGKNLTGAASKLGANRTTLIPYFVAGEALAKKGMIHESIGSAEGLDVVSKSLDATTRQASKDARAKAKAKAEAGKIALELQGQDADGQDVPAPVAAAEVPTPGVAAVKSAVESEGTLSVTEEPTRQSPDTTPDTRPNAEPVESVESDDDVTPYRAINELMNLAARIRLGKVELSTDEADQLTEVMAEVAALIA